MRLKTKARFLRNFAIGSLDNIRKRDNTISMHRITIGNRYILIYPWKFVDTLYTIMGLDGFSDETEILVLDVSIIFNKNFSDSITAASTLQQIRKIQFLRQLIIEIKDIKKQSSYKKTCVNYKVPLTSLIGLIINLICFLYFKNSEIKVLTTINPGIPNFTKNNLAPRLLSRVSRISTIRPFIKRIYSYAWARIPSPMSFLVTHKLLAGRYYMEQELKKNSNKKIKIIKGHSLDYDRYLSSISLTAAKTNLKNTIVFLDTPGPLFSSDYTYSGDKVHKTIEVWYPALCKFFDKLEFLFDSKVIIAAHYKSAFTSQSEVFGGREVFYGRTWELVLESKLVVTEQSSAVSFAVIYKKPIFFIYSDESQNDLEIMHFMENISGILGQPIYNINRLGLLPKTLPRVDENRYLTYEDQFLTSKHDGRTNAQLIEKKVLL